MTPDETRLKRDLYKYQNPDTTRNHIVNVLNLYKGLRYKVEPFVFNSGSQKELCTLQGTIPISYKGSSYNIPICIWLMDTHPYNAPICYVKPTSDMKIKVSIYVDHNGKIYLPYLHEWLPHHSDLLSLIQIMIVTFGEYPPVYAKPRHEHQTPNTTPYPIQPFMPVPGTGGGGGGSGSSSGGGGGGTGSSGGGGGGGCSSGNSGNNSGGGASGTSGAGFPPYPQNSQYTGGNNQVYPPYPAAGTAGFPYQGYGSYGNTTGGGSGYSQSYGGPYPYPPATQPSPTVPSGSSGGSGTITEEHIRVSLLSAVEDKLRRRLKEQFSQLQAELETLRRTQQELTSGSSHLSELFEKLKKEKTELEKNVTILQDKQAELEKEIAKLSDNQSIDVDEAVTTIAPLYKQMLNAFAEEAATEDAIYYLGEGLRCGIIDLDAFLKQVRQLSRRQFTLRALMQRCRQKAGLAG